MATVPTRFDRTPVDSAQATKPAGPSHALDAYERELLGDLFAVNPIRRSLATILVSLAIMILPALFLDGGAEAATMLLAIWFACTGNGSSMPQSAALPAYQAMRLGIAEAEEASATRKKKDDDD